MLVRALVVWLILLGIAICNGALRETVLSPRVELGRAHRISTFSLCGFILIVARLTIRWLHPGSPAAALNVGGLWLGLTLAFEFLAGHYLFRKSWMDLLADYNLARGRIWAAVLVVTLLAPLWAAQSAGMVWAGH